MRSLFLVLLLVGSAHGLFGPIGQLIGNVGDKLQAVTNHIGQTATNLWNGATGQVGNVIGNVVDSAGNVYGQLISTANGIQFASNFLWDNVFGPAYDMMIEGKVIFHLSIDNHLIIFQVDNYFLTINLETLLVPLVVVRFYRKIFFQKNMLN
jgi:hypothetical protein